MSQNWRIKKLPRNERRKIQESGRHEREMEIISYNSVLDGEKKRLVSDITEKKITG